MNIPTPPPEAPHLEERMLAYAVETCLGFAYHPDSCDALGAPRCNACGWSWGAHGQYGRPRPDVEPPYVSDERLAELWADDFD